MYILGLISSFEKRQSYIVLSTELDRVIRDPLWPGLPMALEARGSISCLSLFGLVVFEVGDLVEKTL